MKNFSLSRLIAVIIKETIQLKRDRLTFAMIAGIPIMQLILFGYAINNQPKNLPTVIFDPSPSAYSRTIIAALQNTNYFKVITTPMTETRAEDLLKKGKLQFIISFPSDFEKKLIRDETPKILIEADATDPTAIGSALSSLNGVTEKALQHKLKGSLAFLSQNKKPFSFNIHRHYNPEDISQYNIVPGLIGVILTLTMIIMTSLSITKERERGTMENLLSTPLTPLEVMCGKIIPNIILGYIQTLVVLISAKILFKVPIEGSLLLLSFVIIIFIWCNLAIGFTFSTIASNQLQALQMSIFFFLPSMLLSGFMFPFRGMPEWAQTIGSVLPLTYFLRIVRGIILKGNGLTAIWQELVPICLFLLFVSFIAMKRYKRTLD